MQPSNTMLLEFVSYLKSRNSLVENKTLRQKRQTYFQFWSFHFYEKHLSITCIRTVYLPVATIFQSWYFIVWGIVLARKLLNHKLQKVKLYHPYENLTHAFMSCLTKMTDDNRYTYCNHNPVLLSWSWNVTYQIRLTSVYHLFGTLSVIFPDSYLWPPLSLWKKIRLY